MRFPRPIARSIRSKLLLSYSLLAAIIAAFVFTFFPARLKLQAMRAVEAKAVAIRDMSAFSVSSGLVFDDSTAIAQVLVGAATGRDVSFVVVRDSSGRVKARKGEIGAAELQESVHDSSYVTRDGMTYVTTTAVTASENDDSAKLGTLTIGISLTDLRREVANAQRLGSLVGALILLLGVVIAFAMAALVTKPLSAVSQTMNEIAAGDLSLRASETSDVELTVLVRAFNRMVDGLARAQEELSSINQQLEARVEGRTAELRRSIYDQRRVQSALELSEAEARGNSETLQTLIDVAPQAIVAVDSDWCVTRWNKAAERLFGWSASETLGKPVPYIPDDYLASYQARQSLLMADSTLVPAEANRLHKDGHLVSVLVSASVLRDRKQNVSGYIAILTDLSERKLLDEQLRQSQKMEAVGRLAGGVAHDFNNILTVIASYAALLLEREERAEEREDLLQISGAAAHAAALTRQLLTFSRRQIIQLAPLSVGEIVHDMQPMLRRVLRENISLTTTRGIDGGSVIADRTQLEQVIMNLVVNASDAMPAGGSLTIETGGVELDEGYARDHAGVSPGPYVALVVRDTGVGMDAAVMARVFEPFFTTKEVGQGTGLGLATTYAVVTRLGGHIDIVSEPRQGAAFKIFLPRNPGAEVSSLPLTRLEDLSVKKPRTPTVLLVEDQDSVRIVVRRGLEKSGYRVLEAANGELALALSDTKSEVIDIVVTDLMMPGLNGRMVVDRLKLRRPDLKVVFMSGYADDTVEKRGFTDSGHAFLQKPFAAADLARTIRELLAEPVVVATD